MTIKSASGNEVTTETMTDRLRLAQQEPWSKLKYEDDSSNRAWDMFSQNLVYKGPGAIDQDDAMGDGEEDKAQTKIKSSATDKGKGAAEDDAMDIDTKSKTTQAEAPPPQLRGKWATADFLKAVSGMQEGEGAEAERSHEDIVEIKKEIGAAPKAAGGSKPKASAVAGRKASGAASAGGTKGKSVAFE